MVVTGELLFIFDFIRASILCDDGLDYARAMAYALASQNSVLNMLMFASRTCSDRRFYSLDFISNPEGCNGENHLGSC